MDVKDAMIGGLAQATPPKVVKSAVAGTMPDYTGSDTDRVRLVREIDSVEEVKAIPFRRIVVALDGSEASEAVLPIVRPLAAVFGSRVTLLRVVAPVLPPVYTGHVSGPFLSSLEYRDLQAVAEHAREKAGAYLASRQEPLERDGVAVTSRTVEGPVAPNIVAVAREWDADLIAMSTHGRGGWGRLVSGSAADEVMRSAPCPVLLVRVQDG